MSRACMLIAAAAAGVAAAAMAACGGDSARRAPPPPPERTGPSADEPAPIALERQRAGDAQRGWEALVTEGYVGCGVPRTLWDRVGGSASASRRLDRSVGAELPYFLNAATMPNGVEVVTANCLGCHAA